MLYFLHFANYNVKKTSSRNHQILASFKTSTGVITHEVICEDPFLSNLTDTEIH